MLAILNLGMTTPATTVAAISAEPRTLGKVFSPRAELRAAIVAGVLLALGYLLHVWLEVPYAEGFIWSSLAIGMAFGGRAALVALARGRFDIDVLMVVGAGLSAAIGHPEEGALLLFLFVLSGALEDMAMRRTAREVEALHTLMPTDALVLRAGEWVEADAKSLVAGERIKVRPGERVPADAVVRAGSSSMDQAAITGESMPRSVEPGDELFAGTINTDDPLEAEVLRAAGESSLQRILDLVMRAREQREPVQRAIDRLSQPYAIGVTALGLVVLLGWRYGLERGWVEAAKTAITLLIVASPCALVIATPTATLAAIARAARGGVLFKGGQAIENLARTRSVCFDKTGTLTIGRPRLYEVHPVGWSDGSELLGVAAGLEADSTHPIASAVREAAASRGVAPITPRHANHVQARGIAGSFEGFDARLGTYAFCEACIPTCLRARVREVLSRIQERGHIGVVAARCAPGAEGDGEATGSAAVLIMADAVRPGATTLARDLHALGVRPVRMLTGDNAVTARRVSESLGLDRFDAELLPEDKLRIVGEMRGEARARAGGVAVIGDGVNDAPALAGADASIAIGAIGTAAALESAETVLLADDLAVLPWAVGLARRARATVTRNLVFAISVIVVMGAATLVGAYVRRPLPLSVGVLAHEGGTLLVVLNSLAILVFPGVGRRGDGRGARRGTGEAGRPVAATA